MASPALHRPFILFLLGMGFLVVLSFLLFGMASGLLGEILALLSDSA